ncbi:hypothetical protein P3L10_010912 [Capsicum annuum]
MAKTSINLAFFCIIFLISFGSPLISKVKVMGTSRGSTSTEYMSGDVQIKYKLPCDTDKDCEGICPVFCKNHFCNPQHGCACTKC